MKTYEEAAAEWVKNRFNVKNDVYNVNFDIFYEYATCSFNTCDFSNKGVEVYFSYKIKGRETIRYEKLVDASPADIIREIVTIATDES